MESRVTPTHQRYVPKDQAEDPFEDAGVMGKGTSGSNWTTAHLEYTRVDFSSDCPLYGDEDNFAIIPSKWHIPAECPLGTRIEHRFGMSWSDMKNVNPPEEMYDLFVRLGESNKTVNAATLDAFSSSPPEASQHGSQNHLPSEPVIFTSPLPASRLTPQSDTLEKLSSSPVRASSTAFFGDLQPAMNRSASLPPRAPPKRESHPRTEMALPDLTEEEEDYDWQVTDVSASGARTFQQSPSPQTSESSTEDTDEDNVKQAAQLLLLELTSHLDENPHLNVTDQYARTTDKVFCIIPGGRQCDCKADIAVYIQIGSEDEEDPKIRFSRLYGEVKRLRHQKTENSLRGQEFATLMGAIGERKISPTDADSRKYKAYIFSWHHLTAYISRLDTTKRDLELYRADDPKGREYYGQHWQPFKMKRSVKLNLKDAKERVMFFGAIAAIMLQELARSGKLKPKIDKIYNDR